MILRVKGIIISRCPMEKILYLLPSASKAHVQIDISHLTLGLNKFVGGRRERERGRERELKE